MEPMDPQTQQKILTTALDANESDLDEYEHLLAERFTRDPNMPTPSTIVREASARTFEPPPTREERDGRLAELHRKFRKTK